MSAPTTLRTERLVLRAFTPADAPELRRVVDDAEIARNTLTIPHPYPEGQAEAWIASHREEVAAGRSAVFAICAQSTGELVGAIGLHVEARHRRAELGFWIGRAWRGRGLATEAGAAILEHAFGTLDLGRVFASHFPWNRASGRVMAKLGMRREGTLRGHHLKDDARVDGIVYGVLREEHAARSSSS